jgi:hypothetical protein
MLLTIISVGSVTIPVNTPKLQAKLYEETIPATMFNGLTTTLNFNFTGHDVGSDTLEIIARAYCNSDPYSARPCLILGLNSTEYASYVASGSRD